MKRCLVFLLLIPLLVLAATVSPNLFGRMPLCLIISAVLISAAYAMIVYRLFAFTESSVDPVCTRGAVYHYRFVLSNDTPVFFPHIRVVYSDGCEKKRMDMAVKPHHSESVETEFRFRHIGRYDVGFQSAQVFDLLDLFFLPFANDRHPIVVQPRIDSLENYLAVRNGEDPKQMRPFSFGRGDSEDYDGVRPYASGDSMRRIHWNLTAHTGKYMSRRMEKTEDFSLGVFIDLFPPQADGEEALSIFDSLVESALAAANYGIGRNGTAKFILNRGKEIITEPVMDFAMLRKAAGRLAVCGYDAATRMEDLLGQFQCAPLELINFVVCTSNLNYDLAYCIARLKSFGKNPTLFYILPSGRDPAGTQKILEYLQNRKVIVQCISA